MCHMWPRLVTHSHPCFQGTDIPSSDLDPGLDLRGPGSDITHHCVMLTMVE